MIPCKKTNEGNAGGSVDTGQAVFTRTTRTYE